MRLLLDALVTFPGAVFTALLGVVLVYWLSMLLGAVDLDLLGGADHAGADGAVDGAGHGGDAGHGDVDGADGGDADGGDADGGDADGGDGDGHADGHADGHGGLLSALGALALRRLPMTVSVSLMVIWGWLVSVLGAVTLSESAARIMPLGVFRGVLFAVALLTSIKLASVSARPLVPLFVANKASRREHLVGKLAEVSTGRLDAAFGQVLVGDGGAGLLIDARHEGGATLKRGDRVVVTSWDADRAVVLVEPLDHPTATRVEAAKAVAEEPDAASPKLGETPNKRVLR